MIDPKTRSVRDVDVSVPVHVVRGLGEDHDRLARGSVDPRDSLIFAVGAAIQRARATPLCARLNDRVEYEDAMTRFASSAQHDFLCVAASPSLDILARCKETVERSARAGVRFRVLKDPGADEGAVHDLRGAVAFRSRALLEFEPSRITLAVVDESSILLARTAPTGFTRADASGLGFVASDPAIVATFRDLLEAYWHEAAPRA